MTIEERAKQYTGNVMYEACFIDGATEQRQIDIQKACNTYCRFCPHQCAEYTHDDCQIQIEFRKSMEEEQ